VIVASVSPSPDVSAAAPPRSSPAASLDDALRAELAVLREQHLVRALHPVARRRGACVDTASGPAIDFSSNDYLGLSSDPRLADAAARAAREQGAGAAASRLISGDNPEHHALERDLADFFDAKTALVFSSGYAANTGAIPALVGRGDVIFSDALNHASLIDGCRLSRAAVHVYPHGDVAALRSLLAVHRSAHRRALVVTDGAFSMDGDRAPLDGLIPLAREFDAWTYVDDAHAAGVVGPEGRGTAESFASDLRADVTVGTLGKAFGSGGAFVLGSAILHEYLLNKARSFVFSTGLPPAQAAAAREALSIARAEPWRRAKVAEHARALRAALQAALRARGIDAACVLGEPASAIVPVMVGDSARVMAVGAALAALGFLVGAVRPPTVPAGGARLRIAVSAAHTSEQVNALAVAVADALASPAHDSP
jgi:8-amino-7-oxononanoate synthase